MIKPSMILWGCLLLGAFLATDARAALPKQAPKVPDAVPTEDIRRFRSPRSYEDTLRYFRIVLRRGRVRWSNIANLPTVRAKHVASLEPDTDWMGINIFETQGETRFTILPRPVPKDSLPQEQQAQKSP